MAICQLSAGRFDIYFFSKGQKRAFLWFLARIFLELRNFSGERIRQPIPANLSAA
jgi:hypothetical protein